MTHIFQHPKYYKELRSIRNKLDQAISEQASTEVSSVRPDPGLKQQASSSKLRYTPTGILLGVDLGDKPQAASNTKPEPSSGSSNI